jgi:iron complex transport system permease protein
VSVSGIIGFVGLIVPHVARAAIGHDLRWALAASLPLGAAVVVVGDTIARSAFPPIELPLGVLLSMLGVPAFLYLASRRTRTA